MQAAAKQFVQVRIVHLDHIERRGDAAVTLWDDQHRGTLHLFGLDLRGLGFLAAQVKRVLFNIPDCEILILYGSYAVHKILVHLFFSFIVNNIPTSKPATIPQVNTRTGLGGRFSSV